MGLFNKLRGKSNGKQKANLEELGSIGTSIANGRVDPEFLPELKGNNYLRVFQEMSDNDSTVGAILNAMEMLVRAVNWEVLTHNSETGEEARAFIESVLFDDMSHTWEDCMIDILSFLRYGWSYLEVVYKYRLGPEQSDSSKRSNFNDGKIGIRKLALRNQHTRYKWEFDENGGVQGMWQKRPSGVKDPNQNVFIPIEKALLFRARNNMGSPEGKSILRNAYRSWYFKKYIEDIEAIGIDRDLVGVPVVRIPNRLFSPTTPEELAAYNSYVRMASDTKTGRDSGFVVPSDTYRDQSGHPTNVKLVDVELVNSPGGKTIDVDKVIRRHDSGIARSVLAQFVLLGADNRGAFNLSDSQETLFAKALEGYLDSIAATFNKHLIPKICMMNGYNRELFPYLKPGPVGKEDIEKFTRALSNLASAGMPLFPDEDMEVAVRDRLDLPDRPISVEPGSLEENDLGDLDLALRE